MKPPFAHSLARPIVARLNPDAAPVRVFAPPLRGWSPAFRLRRCARRMIGTVLALFAAMPLAAMLLRADLFFGYCAGLCLVCMAAIVVSAAQRKAARR